MLKVKNNWENLEWTDGGKPVPNVLKIKSVRVEWPDERVSYHYVKWITVRVPYDDHGHAYDGIQHQMYVEIHHRGLDIDLPLYQYLDKLKVTINEMDDVISFETPKVPKGRIE